MEQLALNRWVNLYGARLMGKSSLVVRAQRKLRDKGQRVGYASMEEIVTDESKPPNQRDFLDGLFSLWESSLGMDSGIRTLPQEGDAGEVFQRMVDRMLLACGPGRLVLILDEVDVITRLPYGGSMLNAFRLVHEGRAREPERYERILFVLVGLRPLADLAAASRGLASQFCAGVRLEDFQDTEKSVRTICQSLPSFEGRNAAISRVLWHTGGQPLLTMLMLDNARRCGMTALGEIDTLASDFAQRKANDPEILFRNARRLIVEDRRDSILALGTYLGLLNRAADATPAVAPGSDLLQASGLVRVKDGKLEIKGPIFRIGFRPEVGEQRPV